MQSMRTEHANVAASAISYAAAMHIENTAAYITDIRDADLSTRTITGIVAPYHEATHLVPTPAGERIMPGAFTRSLAGRETKIPLVVGHARHTEAAVGRSRSWQDTVIGLRGEFVVKPGPEGDNVLEDCHGGWLTGMSIEFASTSRGVGADGVSEVRAGRLIACALVTTPAYERARIDAVGTPEVADVGAARSATIPRVPPRPVVDLTPVVNTNAWGNLQRLA